jgi:dTDP-4-amino-4,6-dideoxygalactose transaminase
MKDLIHIDLVPNFEDDDYEIIKKIEARYGAGQEIEKAKNEVLKILRFYFPQGEIFFFNSARGALSFLLTQLDNIEKNEVITQAFSCLVVPNAIKFAGYKPIYVDIDETYNLYIEDLKRKINERTRAIIIQNTFGIPAKIDEILGISQQNNILVIENLTHSLGAKYKGKYLGNFSDFALLSFNRNKVISSIIGGALVVNNKNFLEKIKNSYELLPEPSQKEIQKIIFTGKVLYQAKKNYNFLTKIYLKFLRKIGKTVEMVSSVEKQNKKPENYLFKFPDILFPLLLNQLRKLERFNEKRKEAAKIYMTRIYTDSIYPNKRPNKLPKSSDRIFSHNSGKVFGQDSGNNFSLRDSVSEPIFLRFPILIENRDFVLEKFKKENIYLGDWYRCVLDPCSDLKFFDYKIGSCPKAEEITKKIINLPTLIDKEKAELIIQNLLIL